MRYADVIIEEQTIMLRFHTNSILLTTLRQKNMTDSALSLIYSTLRKNRIIHDISRQWNIDCMKPNNLNQCALFRRSPVAQSAR